MKITTLQERIEKATAKVEKKENTIVKKTAQIQKKSAMLAKKYGIDAETFDKYNREGFSEEASHEIYWTMCDIDYLKDDIARGAKEIEATKKTIEKYQAQLAGEIEKETIIIKEVPESMKQMQKELAERWDAWDIAYRDALRKEYAEQGYTEFIKNHRYSEYEYRNMTDEKIHETNMNDAKLYVIQLYYRIKDVTGEVTNWEGITMTVGAWGCPTLNGYVEGKEGRALVESIGAGGYNIQRFHIRTLVKEIK